MRAFKRIRSVVSSIIHQPVLRGSVLMVLTAGAALLPVAASDDVGMQTTLLRTFAIVVLAFLPGWLFLRFVSVRAASVWEEYVLNLHRLGIDLPQYLPKPPTNSIYYRPWVEAGGEVYQRDTNLYREKFDAHYGKTTVTESGDRAQPKPETFFPVFVATAVFAAGWTVVLSRSFLDTLATSNLGDPSTTDMLRFGFVGAYLFTLQMLIRRYFQADLKASAYVSSVVRIVTALCIVLIVDLAAPATTIGARASVAFIVGFFPMVGLQAIQKAAALALRTVVPSLRNDYPLSDIDGLSVWYEARLLELGIEDMENLATANLVDVTLHSRVPVARLVDWVDQAHLYLHLEPKKGGHQSSRDLLRRLGIRTATALEEAVRPCPAGAEACARGLVTAGANEQLRTDLLSALNGDGKLTASVTTSLLKVFDNDPNLKHVRHWKRDWSQPTPPVAAPPQVPVLVGTSGSNGH
jgi:hypothetical protein